MDARRPTAGWLCLAMYSHCGQRMTSPCSRASAANRCACACTSGSSCAGVDTQDGVWNPDPRDRRPVASPTTRVTSALGSCGCITGEASTGGIEPDESSLSSLSLAPVVSALEVAAGAAATGAEWKRCAGTARSSMAPAATALSTAASSPCGCSAPSLGLLGAVVGAEPAAAVDVVAVVDAPATAATSAVVAAAHLPSPEDRTDLEPPGCRVSPFDASSSITSSSTTSSSDSTPSPASRSRSRSTSDPSEPARPREGTRPGTGASLLSRDSRRTSGPCLSGSGVVASVPSAGEGAGGGGGAGARAWGMRRPERASPAGGVKPSVTSAGLATRSQSAAATGGSHGAASPPLPAPWAAHPAAPTAAPARAAPATRGCHSEGTGESGDSCDRFRLYSSNLRTKQVWQQVCPQASGTENMLVLEQKGHSARSAMVMLLVPRSSFSYWTRCRKKPWLGCTWGRFCCNSSSAKRSE
mmetsp:Transcript_17846/g.57136  ORF Transcript_17846/g.57136 Transcript_17846/m.57136 type:complete len:470 (+) Transcript_17846:326-1735(+)